MRRWNDILKYSYKIILSINIFNQQNYIHEQNKMKLQINKNRGFTIKKILS